MINDKKIYESVGTLREMCDSWIGIVKSMNQDAYTDSILRQICKKAEEIKKLESTNKPE